MAIDLSKYKIASSSPAIAPTTSSPTSTTTPTTPTTPTIPATTTAPSTATPIDLSKYKLAKTPDTTEGLVSSIWRSAATGVKKLATGEPIFKANTNINSPFDVLKETGKALINTPGNIIKPVTSTLSQFPDVVKGLVSQFNDPNSGSIFQQWESLGNSIGETLVLGTANNVKNFFKDLSQTGTKAAQSFEKSRELGGLETTGKILEAVHKTAVEDPIAIPMTIYGAEKMVNLFQTTGLLSELNNTTDPALRAQLQKQIVDINSRPDIISRTAQPVITVAKDTISLVGETVKNAAFNQRVKEFDRAFNQPKNLSATEAKYGKDSSKFAAELEQEGVDLSVEKDARGKMDWTKAKGNVREVMDRDGKVLREVLRTSGKDVNVTAAYEDAKNRAMSVYKGTEQAKALNYLDQEYNAYKAQYKDIGFIDDAGNLQVPAEYANDIKSDLWSKSTFPATASPLDKTNSGASNLFGGSMMGSIENIYPDDDLIHQLNNRLGNLHSLVTTLDKSQGGTFYGGFMGRQTAKILGGIMGGGAAGGNPIAIFGGAILADTIANALQNPNTSLARWILTHAKVHFPEVLSQIEAQYGITADSILKPQGTPIPNKEGGFVKIPFQGSETPQGYDAIPQEDRNFLSKFSAKVSGNKFVNDKDIKMAQDILSKNGYSTPNTAEQIADQIDVFKNSAEGNTFNPLENQSSNQVGLDNKQGGFIANPLKEGGAKINTISDAIKNAKSNQLSTLQWDEGIKSGDIPKGIIYRSKDVLLHEPARHMIEDTAKNLNNNFPGLGDKFAMEAVQVEPSVANFRKVLDSIESTLRGLDESSVQSILKANSQLGQYDKALNLFSSQKDLMKGFATGEQYRKAIAAGQMNPNDIFAGFNPAKGTDFTSVFKPEIAKVMTSDIVQVLSKVQESLGQRFLQEMSGLEPTTKNFLEAIEQMVKYLGE